MAINNADRKGFMITEGRGIQLKLANGYVVSIQFGPGNYCENRDRSMNLFDTQPKDFAKAFLEEQIAAGKIGSNHAETAVFHSVTGSWMRPPWNDNGDDVQGWQSPDDVIKLLAWAASLPAPPGIACKGACR